MTYTVYRPALWLCTTHNRSWWRYLPGSSDEARQWACVKERTTLVTEKQEEAEGKLPPDFGPQGVQLQCTVKH